MALMVSYHAPGITQEMYEAARREIDWDHGPPAGCLLHMAAFDEDGAHTIDIWESQAQIDAYLENRFSPVLAKLGIEPGVAKILDLHVVAVSPNIEEHFIRAPAI